MAFPGVPSSVKKQLKRLKPSVHALGEHPIWTPDVLKNPRKFAKLRVWNLSPEKLKACLEYWISRPAVDFFACPGHKRGQTLCMELLPADWEFENNPNGRATAKFALPVVNRALWTQKEYLSNRDVVLVSDLELMSEDMTQTLEYFHDTLNLHVLVLNVKLREFLDLYPCYRRDETSISTRSQLEGFDQNAADDKLYKGFDTKISEQEHEFVTKFVSERLQSGLHAKHDLGELMHAFFSSCHKNNNYLSFRAIWEVMSKLSYNRDATQGGFYGFFACDLTSDPDPVLVYTDPATGASLWFGGQHHLHPTILLKHQINALVSIGASQFNASLKSTWFPDLVTCEVPKLMDDCHSSALEYMNPAVDFMVEQLKVGKNVLVHCHRGMSRSAAFVLGFMIKHLKMSLETSYNILFKLRPRIIPSRRLQMDLMLLESQLGRRETFTFIWAGR